MRTIRPSQRQRTNGETERAWRRQGRGESRWPLELVHTPEILRTQCRLWCAQHAAGTPAAVIARARKRDGLVHVMAAQDGRDLARHWHRAQPSHEAPAYRTVADGRRRWHHASCGQSGRCAWRGGHV